MLTPSSGVVRANPEHACTECTHDLTNVTRYPGPVQFRCQNRACAHCWLPAARPVHIPAGAAIKHWGS